MAISPLKIKFSWFVTLLLASMTLFGCKTRQETIYIISTNDIHGAFENIPNLATVVENYRSQDTASVFLVDAGDRWTGNPYVDMAVEDGVRVDGKPIIDLMNSLGYDAATFGNHEFDKGLAHLDNRTRGADFPVILANVDTRESALAQPEPYIILTSKGGNWLALLGLITNFINGHPDGKDEIFEGTRFPSPYETAEKYTSLGHRNEVLIALTHTGDDADSLMALHVPGYDLIIGGHTHRVIDRLNPVIVNGTRITQTGKSLKYAGITTIRMKGNRISSIDNELIKLDTIAPHPAYLEKIEKYYDNPVLTEAVGTLGSDMTKAGAINMFTDIIRADMGTDFAFYHLGGVRVAGFPKGDITRGDLYAAEPFSSTAVKCRMTLDEIKRMIINKFNDTQNMKESHREDIFPSGMNYTIITDERGEAVDITFDHRLPYESGTIYSVAMSDYMFGNYKFDKPQAEEVSVPLTDLFEEYFKKNSPVKPDNAMRVFIRRR